MTTQKVVTYEWATVVERLKYHRERLGITKEEMIAYTKKKYHRTFWAMSDEDILAMGKKMAESTNKRQFLDS